MKNILKLWQEWNELYEKIERFATKLHGKGLDESEIKSKLKEQFGNDHPCYWYERICNPIAEQIKQAGGFSHVEVLGPMGVAARVSFHCFNGEGRGVEDIVASLSVTPELDIKDGQSILMKTDYTVNTGRFTKGTLGEVNGLNYGQDPIPNDTQGEEWLKYLDKE